MSEKMTFRDALARVRVEADAATRYDRTPTVRFTWAEWSVLNDNQRDTVSEEARVREVNVHLGS